MRLQELPCVCQVPSNVVEHMITHASLFSGIGAADLAAAELGWRNVFDCEINPFCRKVLQYHFPDSMHYEDIKTTNFKEYNGKINVLSGGFPCQGFSLAGQRRGTEDDRYLWPQMLRAIHECRPDYVLGENVGGILTMVESGHAAAVGQQTSLFGESDTIYERRGRYVTEIIRADLEREGYALQIFVIPAVAVGAPHRRDRVWFLAKRIVADPIVARSENLRGRSNGILGFEGSADTLRKRLEGGASRGMESGKGRTDRDAQRVTTGAICLPHERWCGFPTTEPTFCRGDDGISSRLDTATISFARWRKEALQAYGNSMVMPLVKEIFIAIQQDMENDKSNDYGLQRTENP